MRVYCGRSGAAFERGEMDFCPECGGEWEGHLEVPEGQCGAWVGCEKGRDCPSLFGGPRSPRRSHHGHPCVLPPGHDEPHACVIPTQAEVR